MSLPVRGVDTAQTFDVPYRITDEAYVPAARYYDQKFYELEHEKLWMRTWQPACRSHEIPEPGDFVEYQIMDQSILVVRESSDVVRAFHNACRHRGTALGRGVGSFRASQIVCPFHGWRWSLDGTNAYVYAREAFRADCVQQCDVDLKAVAVGERFGFVWVNLAENPPPFDEHFSGIDATLGPQRLDLMHVKWWHQVEFPANWKVTQEAFFESYHVMQTHPEMALFLRDDDYEPVSRYGVDPKGHGWMDSEAPNRLNTAERAGRAGSSKAGKSPAESFVAAIRAMCEGAESFATRPQLEKAEEILARHPHDDFFPLFFEWVREDAANNAVPLPPIESCMTGHFTVFPNFTGVVQFGNALVYRSRPHPTDPNRAIYDFWALEIPPEGTPISRPVEGEGPLWQDLWFMHQDANNIERMQIGLRTGGHQHNRLGIDVERMIINWHQALDRLLAAP